VPDSENPHPVGVVLDVPLEARLSKFSVTDAPKAVMLTGVEVSAETLVISLRTNGWLKKKAVKAIVSSCRRKVRDLHLRETDVISRRVRRENENAVLGIDTPHKNSVLNVRTFF